MQNLKYVIILGFAFIIIGSYWIYLDFVPETSVGVVCTADARQCSDGSYVSRVLPRCEFAGCPDGSNPLEPEKTGELEDIDTSNWKTYRNEKYGFEVRYPPMCSIYVNEVFKKLPTPSCLFVYVREENNEFIFEEYIERQKQNDKFVVAMLPYKIDGETAYHVKGAVVKGTDDITFEHSSFIYTFPEGDFLLREGILNTFKFIK